MFSKEFKNTELDWEQDCSVTSFKKKILYCTNFWDNSDTFSWPWNKGSSEHLKFKCQMKSFWNPISFISTFLFHKLMKSHMKMEKSLQMIQRPFNSRHSYRLWRVMQCPWCIVHRESGVRQQNIWKVWVCFINFWIEFQQTNVINRLG